MIVYPAVDLLRGHVVQLVGGQRDTEQVDLPDPLAVVDRWAKEGAEWLHVIDLNGAFGQDDNQKVILDILADRRVKVQVGGGIRTEEQIQAYLDAGAKRIIVGTKALRDPLWLKTMAKRYPRQLVLAVDAKAGSLVAHGWMKDTGQDFVEAAKKVDDLGLAGFLYTAVHVEGRLQGIDREGVTRLLRAVRTPVIASGGVTTLDDVKWLRDAGCDGAVLGLALYKGRIPFPDAQRLAEAPTA